MAGAELQQILEMVQNLDIREDPEELTIQNNASESAGSMALASFLTARFIDLCNQIENAHNPTPTRIGITYLLNTLIIYLRMGPDDVLQEDDINEQYVVNEQEKVVNKANRALAGCLIQKFFDLIEHIQTTHQPTAARTGRINLLNGLSGLLTTTLELWR